MTAAVWWDFQHKVNFASIHVYVEHVVVYSRADADQGEGIQSRWNHIGRALVIRESRAVAQRDCKRCGNRKHRE